MFINAGFDLLTHRHIYALSVTCDTNSIMTIGSNYLNYANHIKTGIWEEKPASHLFKVEILCLAYFITKTVGFKIIDRNFTDMKNVTCENYILTDMSKRRQENTN